MKHNKRGAPVSSHHLPPPLSCDYLPGCSLQLYSTFGLTWEVWLEACAPAKQQVLTTFSCCFPCSAYEQDTSCISVDYLLVKQEESSILRCSVILRHVHLHQARKRLIPGTCRRFQLLFSTLLCTEDKHWHGRFFRSVVILLPHKKPRFVINQQPFAIFPDLQFDMRIWSSYFLSSF